MSLGVAGTYYDTKVTKRDEIYDDAYRYREGKAVDGIWGLQSAGLFRDKEDIENSPEQKLGSTVQPGDIKYVDQNGDNVIDDKDEVYISKTLISIYIEIKAYTLVIVIVHHSHKRCCRISCIQM